MELPLTFHTNPNPKLYILLTCCNIFYIHVMDMEIININIKELKKRKY